MSASPAVLTALRDRQLALLTAARGVEERLQRLHQTITTSGGKETQNKNKKKNNNNQGTTNNNNPNKPSKSPSAASPASSAASSLSLPSDDDPSRWWDQSTYTVDTAGVVPRLSALCAASHLTKYRFYRVAGDYYDWPLEQRQSVLGAPSIRHLWKSVVMENTRFKPPETDGNRRIILVIVSYAERLHKERLANAVYDRYKRLTPDALSKRAYDANWRLADNDEAIAMTGYEHNGMTPVGMKSAFLMVVSDSILTLETGSFFLGGGEVDVKLRLSVKQFIQQFQPIVAKITNDA